MPRLNGGAFFPMTQMRPLEHLPLSVRIKLAEWFAPTLIVLGHVFWMFPFRHLPEAIRHHKADVRTDLSSTRRIIEQMKAKEDGSQV